MTAKYIRSIINRLNKGTLSERLFLRPLKNNVDFGYYWDEKPSPKNPSLSRSGPYKFYFIRDEGKQYVSAVLDMTHDLHWYVLPKHRKAGYLGKALQNLILPHLFQSRDEQHITISRYHLSNQQIADSEAVAFRAGFKTTGEAKYLLTKKDFGNKRMTLNRPNGINEERLEELKMRINDLSQSLWRIQTEAEVCLGVSSKTEAMYEVVHKISSLSIKLEDAIWDFKNTANK